MIWGASTGPLAIVLSPLGLASIVVNLLILRSLEKDRKERQSELDEVGAIWEVVGEDGLNRTFNLATRELDPGDSKARRKDYRLLGIPDSYEPTEPGYRKLHPDELRELQRLIISIRKSYSTVYWFTIPFGVLHLFLLFSDRPGERKIWSVIWLLLAIAAVTEIIKIRKIAKALTSDLNGGVVLQDTFSEDDLEDGEDDEIPEADLMEFRFEERLPVSELVWSCAEAPSVSRHGFTPKGLAEFWDRRADLSVAAHLTSRTL